MRDGLSLMKNVLRTLAESVLIPLGLTAVGSATDAAIQKKIFWIRNNCTDSLEQRNGKYHKCS